MFAPCLVILGTPSDGECVEVHVIPTEMAYCADSVPGLVNGYKQRWKEWMHLSRFGEHRFVLRMRGERAARIAFTCDPVPF